MALRDQQIKFFLERIDRADYQTFDSSVQQLFKYLEKEVGDNPVYKEYEESGDKWVEWRLKLKLGGGWSIPDDFDKAKSLAYHLYKLIADQREQVYKIGFLHSSSQSVNKNINEFNQSFLDYFKQALEDIVNADPQITEGNQANPIMGNRIFIIHGHDNELKKEVQLLLSRVNLNDIVLSINHIINYVIIDTL